MKKLAIIGSGDLGQLIAYHAANDNHYDVVGFFDDFVREGVLVNDLPVLGKTNLVKEQFKRGGFDCVMLGIGYKHMATRKSMFEALNNDIPFGKIIHSDSYVDSSVIVGGGVFVLPGCTVDKHVVLGDNVLLNTAVVIAHDSKLGSHCFLSPAVNIAGKVHIKECCIIGINATVIDNIAVESNIQIGGGAVVIENLSVSGLYVGIPAKLKKPF